MYMIRGSGYFGESKSGYVHVSHNPDGLPLEAIVTEYLRNNGECSLLHIAIFEKVED